MNLLQTLKEVRDALDNLSALSQVSFVVDLRTKQIARLNTLINQIEKAEPDYEMVIDYDGLVLLRGELKHPHGTALYTFPPDAQAEIDRLTKRMKLLTEPPISESLVEAVHKYISLTKVEFSSESMAKMVQYFIRQQLAEREGWQLVPSHAIDEINKWAEAYPLDLFPAPDFKLVEKVLADAGLSLTAVSAANMRHVITNVRDMLDAPKQEEVK